jgi:hypothetical protein
MLKRVWRIMKDPSRHRMSSGTLFYEVCYDG